MTTIEIAENNHTAQYPSTWSELSNPQFEFIIKNWQNVVNGIFDQNEFLLRVLYFFLGIKRTRLHSWKDKNLSQQQLEDKYANIWQLTETLNWLFRTETTPDGSFVLLDYTEIENRFPVLHSHGIDFHGPATAMLDITFGEYRHAWDKFEAYGISKSPADLDAFVATLYRPLHNNIEQLKLSPDFDGNHRQPFNPNLTQHYAALLADVPSWKKSAIWLWFFNADKYIKSGDVQIGNKIICFETLFTTKKYTDDDENESLDENDLGLIGLLFMIAESKLFGSPAHVDRTNYIDILTALLYWKKQSDNLKSLYPSN
jgi:hypothetical protein